MTKRNLVANWKPARIEPSKYSFIDNLAQKQDKSFNQMLDTLLGQLIEAIKETKT